MYGEEPRIERHYNGYRDEKRKRRRLGLMARIIEHACVEKIVEEMNELAVHYRANKPKIDWLRRGLELVRQPPAGRLRGISDRGASGRSG